MTKRQPFISALILAALTAGCADPAVPGTGSARIIDYSNHDPASLSDAEIAAAASLDVYFEHASVGGYIVGPDSEWSSDGMAALAAISPRYFCDKTAWSGSYDADWFDTNAGLGHNSRGNPDATVKVSGFTASMNESSGQLPGKIDVAMYKFCYIDTPTSGSSLFETAKSAMEALQSSYPGVTFVWWTMPIKTTGESTRQTYNDLVRAYCSDNDQWLFDIASIESHDDSGVLHKDFLNREILYSGYSLDGGHPNAAGTLKLAKAYWRLIAEIAKAN